MEKEPLVSVIVPNYNYSRYLPERLDSILNQSFRDFELILLDDASTDESVQIMERYKAQRPDTRIIVNEKNGGSPFRQWMKGIQLARGKWIWIAEADDVASPDFLAACMYALAGHPKAVACLTGIQLIGPEGEPLPGKGNYWDGFPHYTTRTSACFDGRFYVNHKLYWSCCMSNASAVVFSRQAALRLTDSPFLSMRHSGDWLFWVQMALQGDVVEVYRNLDFFRRHDACVTLGGKKTGRGIEEDIFVVSEVERALPDIPRYKKRLCHGILYRRIKHLPLTDREKDRYFALLAERLKGTKKDYTLLLWNQYLRVVCPWLLTWKRDRTLLPD